MIERILISTLLITVGVGVYVLLTRHIVTRIGETSVNDELLGRLSPGIPGIVYFWSEACVSCRMAQKPALETLRREFGQSQVQIINVDVMARPDLADAWGVLSLPTTFIVDANGQPRRVNHGVTPASKLKQQIQVFGGKTG